METAVCLSGAAMAAAKRRRVAGPDQESIEVGGMCWAELPQDVSVLVCQFAGPRCVSRLCGASRRASDLARGEGIWRCFCRARWGHGANFHVYKSAKELYLDRNGWFPQRHGREGLPAFDVERLSLHSSCCTTMDLRFAGDEVIVVSEAPPGKPSKSGGVQVVDFSGRRVRQLLDVSDSTINCCDTADDMVCLGSNDRTVRLLRRCEGADGSGGGECYEASATYPCLSEVNDLRLTREDAVIAVRTHPNRHPAGLDVIPLCRPDARKSFPGACRATRHKYIHALDGFEEGCSLSSVVCTGEHPTTTAFSIMLFDFRRKSPCVVDLAVSSAVPGQSLHTSMLWPLRGGPSPLVYANLQSEGRYSSTIAMADFRFPSGEPGMQFQLPRPVDDFRCFGGSIYAASSCPQRGRMDILRYQPGRPQRVERLSSVVGSCSPGGRSPHEDLKVLAISQRGFALSYGQHLVLGGLAEARWQDVGDGL